MFVRKKQVKDRVYLQLVENRREGSKVKQEVIATLGRLDELRESGALDSVVHSSARFCENVFVLWAYERGEAPVVSSLRIGIPLVFERLWRETGCQAVISQMVSGRRFGFSLERAIFLTVLHRLVQPGSDRAAASWRRAYKLDEIGEEDLTLHQLYRAMAWLGQVLPEDEQDGRTPFSPRCVKDLVEERLFLHRKDRFSPQVLMLFDTTSLFVYGQGGETLGQRGYSRDHRPELKQIVVALVVDLAGNPICCEIWPGNTTDVKSLVPMVDRLRTRFQIDQVCVVADRGMLSLDTVHQLESEERGWLYILGTRLRKHAEVNGEVLRRGGRYRTVTFKRRKADPLEIKIKEIWVDGRRYVVCLNEEQRRKDQADRRAVVASLHSKLKSGAKSLVGNTAYRRFLKKSGQGKGLEIDEDAIKREERYDGKWVLRTNTSWDAELVAFAYKQLWTVEALFRGLKDTLETRPIYHKRDETIRGHIFCSFLALILRKELLDRIERRGGENPEWAEILRSLDQVTETRITYSGKDFALRTEPDRVATSVLAAVGVALPPPVRSLGSI